MSCALFAYCYILVDIRTLSSFSLILKNLFAITRGQRNNLRDFIFKHII